MAQWIERQPANQRVTGLIPSQGTRLGCRPGLQLGAHKKQPLIDVSLPLFLPLFPCLKINKIKILEKALAGVAQGLSASLQTKGSLVQFSVRAHVWVAGQVPSSGVCLRGNHTLMFLSLSPSLLLSLKINKIF